MILFCKPWKPLKILI